jgi:hypothetical protein
MPILGAVCTFIVLSVSCCVTRTNSKRINLAYLEEKKIKKKKTHTHEKKETDNVLFAFERRVT